MRDTPPHRKALKRFNRPNHVHELTFSCHNRLPLLSQDRTCDYLARAVIKSCEKYDFGIVAYVFMPTHVHLLALPNKSDYSISEFLRSFKQSVARREIAYLKWNEPEKLNLLSSGWESQKYLFWMHGGGYDRNIVNPDTLQKSINYIHNNPVRKGLVSTPAEWKWSSAKDILSGEKGEIPIVKSLML